MKLYLRLFTLAILVLLLPACNKEETPDDVLMAAIESLKNNDVKTLVKISMSNEDYEKAAKEFEAAKSSPSESDKIQFSQMMSLLTSDGAEDQLMAMAAPKLEELRAQLPMLLMMGKGLVGQAIQSSPGIPDSQKESATKILGALLDFVGENDILSEEMTRKAISAAVTTAKSLDMQSLDDLQGLSFDDAMDKASLVMAGSKNVLNAYGISLDDLLGSMEVSDVVDNGDNATMKLAYEFLGQEISQDVKMIKRDGKWVTDK
jgi:hypothetical protein